MTFQSCALLPKNRKSLPAAGRFDLVRFSWILEFVTEATLRTNSGLLSFATNFFERRKFMENIAMRKKRDGFFSRKIRLSNMRYAENNVVKILTFIQIF